MGDDDLNSLLMSLDSPPRNVKPISEVDALKAQVASLHRQLQLFEAGRDAPGGPVEKHSGLGVKNRLVASTVVDQYFLEAPFLALASVGGGTPAGGGTPSESQSRPWATVGVLAEKRPPKEGAGGRQYSLWRLSDLNGATRSLFLFGAAHADHWRMPLGALVAVLNAKLRAEDPGPGRDASSSLSVESGENILHLGTSSEYGTCLGARKSDGGRCTAAVNIARGAPYCIYHAPGALRALAAQGKAARVGTHGQGGVSGAKPRLELGGAHTRVTHALTPRAPPRPPTARPPPGERIAAQRRAYVSTEALRELAATGRVPGMCGATPSGPRPPPTHGQRVLLGLVATEAATAAARAAKAAAVATASLTRAGGGAKAVADRVAVDKATAAAVAAAAVAARDAAAVASSLPSVSRGMAPWVVRPAQSTHPAQPTPCPVAPPLRGPDVIVLDAGDDSDDDGGVVITDSVNDSVMDSVHGSVRDCSTRDTACLPRPPLVALNHGPIIPTTTDGPTRRAVAHIAALGGLPPPNPNGVTGRGAAGGVGRPIAPTPRQVRGGGGGNPPAATAGNAPGGKRGFAEMFGDLTGAVDAPDAASGSLHTALAASLVEESLLRSMGALEQRDALVSKLKDITEMVVDAIKCKKCGALTERPTAECRQGGHPIARVKATKRFFTCRGCAHFTTSLDARYPGRPCAKCGGNNFDKASSYRGSTAKVRAEDAPDVADRQALLPRGVEHEFSLK